MDLQVDDVIAKAKKDESVLAVMLFGSQAHGEGMPASDVDVCAICRLFVTGFRLGIFWRLGAVRSGS